MSRLMGYADVLVGLQYGDEGKAKIVDFLAKDYDVIARFNGGANAGHTVATAQGTLKLRQIPSAVFYPDKLLYIGSGCAIGIVQMVQEIRQLEALGLSLKGRLYISSRCVIVQPTHFYVDILHGKEIGTTGNGIGPCYADRALRMRDGKRVSFQIRDLLQDPSEVFRQIFERYEQEPGVRIAGEASRPEAALKELSDAWDVLQEYVTDDALFLVDKVNAGSRVLFEGAQSVLLDVMHGDQPFVTSSHTSPSYAYVGGDLPAKYHRKCIGVAKAIVSRVGAGTFPSELGADRSEDYCRQAALNGVGQTEERENFDPLLLLRSQDQFEQGIALRMLTGEYGTGSGRPRRVGLLDVGQLAEVVALHGIDEIFLNKCDCLGHFAHTSDACIPLVFGNGLNRGRVSFPAFSLEGNDVPPTLLLILDFIQEETGCKIRGVGIGPEREQLIILHEDE